MAEPVIETHPLPPFTPPNAKLLMLGSFPPPRARWKMDFYYPNFQNDMWRIFGLVFFGEADYFVENDGKNKRFRETEIRAFLAEKGIAVYDTAYKVRRLQGNASDKFLQVVEPVDLAALLEKMPLCDTIMTTGELATDTLLSLMPSETPKPKIGAHVETCLAQRALRLYRLPSSSRAYPLALEKKAAAYRTFFAELGLLSD
ncbi:DNA glycosylase [Neisseria sp. N95_16]|uniref:Uracil-DNA glycosylase family protein n=1 Tax=Neisseria brasiliensis TaxID=2666100 RepID=A0A5Q3RZQ2_9NEIS|nr:MULTISPECIES: uracil-DNA glycosylase family protein [Neisseria]MRN38306.1 uracil-DNA glycosylase family protein [Neisseria brasiliensis]PJO10286.1 DNA glycosylase [Neisseria sp. N95_16]PJO77437.1 DNA glycosylase [Neisseria sp. N177_16]QGL25301.1 uracil-DNA glycosylase family protein [Neisseria brasiliensis]